jgi:catechol 2,3-dioxygenase-like lactoylglutathione lyase family enzyme
VDFWAGQLGFEVVARREGPDTDLAALWSMHAEGVSRQALLRTPGATAGALHLVQFAQPAEPVRRGAQTFDHLPKNLDVYVRDLPARFEALRAAGARFRSEPVTAPGPGAMVFREVHMAGHDDINVVLLEVIDGARPGGPAAGYDTCYNAKGCAGIGPLVTIVPDLGVEDAFWSGVLGMRVTLDIRLAGPAMEKMIGLPAGAALLLKVYGDPAEPLGRVEVIEYERAAGRNLFARARAPARGTLHANWRSNALDPLLARLARASVPVTDHGTRRLIYGTGRVLSFHSPAGLRIEVQERQHA